MLNAAVRAACISQKDYGESSNICQLGKAVSSESCRGATKRLSSTFHSAQLHLEDKGVMEGISRVDSACTAAWRLWRGTLHV